jgi:riboflavin transporter 2
MKAIWCGDQMRRGKNFYGTALLLTIFGLSTWLDVNGVWVELPLIVNEAPEGWTLPSYLTLAVALSNIGPLILIVLKLLFKERLNERIFIYIEIIVGIISCALIAEYWNKTSHFAGRQRSVLFLVLVFLLGTLDTTSTVTYGDYMKRYHANLLNALYLGESLTSLLPSVLASIQGVGGEAICRENSTYPEYSEPRFTVRVYFWIFVVIICLSLFAFLILEYSKISHSYRTRSYYDSSRQFSSYELSMESEPTSVNVATVQSMSKRLYYGLLCLGFLSSIILFGILPSIGTYALLPYSQRAYYISSLILPISNPLSVLIGLFVRSIVRFLWIFVLFGVATCAAIYVLLVALFSPCPPLHDSAAGAVIVISCYFLTYLALYYIRLVIGNRIRQEYQRQSGLFWFGAASQMGSLVGAIPMYLLVNTYSVFESRNACQAYCFD